MKIKGEVKKILFEAKDSGYTVFVLETADQDITVCGYAGSIYAGEELEIAGNWRVHVKYGRQFWLEQIKRPKDISLKGIKNFLCSNLIKGIGPKLGQELVTCFGKEILDILDNEPEKLLSVSGIGPKKLQTIVDSWQEQKQARELALFLQSYGISTGYAQKILKKYGDSAISKIKQNPYTLAKDIKGIGFKRADEMALKLGLSKDSFFRLEAGTIYTLHKLSEQGHFFYPQEELLLQLEDLFSLDKEVILAALDKMEQLNKIFRVNLKEQGISQAIYLGYFYRLEQEIATRVFHLATFSSPAKANNLFTEIENLEKKQKITLSEEQKQAVVQAIESKFFILTGGPGTGKTTITKFIVDYFKNKKYTVKLCAPTGRAAKRLEQATGHKASTIHRLLKASPEGGFEYGEEKKLKTDVLIVDEASMLDGPIFLALLRALPLTARLILVGDINQLPAIGPGNILSDLLQSQVIASKCLQTIFRQAKTSLIVLNAHRINQGKLPLSNQKPAPESDFFWIEEDNLGKIQKLVVKLCVERIPKVYGFHPRDVQILTPMHKGELGTIALNSLLQARLNASNLKRAKSLKRGQTIFVPGDKVIQLSNNYDKQVFNGDLGLVKDIDEEKGVLLVDFDGIEVEYLREELDELNLAYAISVHKSQGSEFPVVIMPLVTQHFILLQRNLIYTGLTRAKKLMILIGSKKALFIGLSKIGQDKRYTHLKYRLQELFNG
ncbi:MAG: ATP-dependent RecD-like DNA helicase [Desulfonauticus sp.]|nr:ATP-dependent RecD-like DNA helicase [Desulfonauticus sp.]